MFTDGMSIKREKGKKGKRGRGDTATRGDGGDGDAGRRRRGDAGTRGDGDVGTCPRFSSLEFAGLPFAFSACSATLRSLRFKSKSQ